MNPPDPGVAAATGSRSSAPAEPDGEHGAAEHLVTFLVGTRWFAGKGRRTEFRSSTALPWLTGTDEWPAVRSEIVEVAYPGDGSDRGSPDDRGPAEAGGPLWPTELYQVAVSYHRAPQPELAHAEIGRWSVPDLGAVVAYDAAQDPAAGRVLLRALIQEQQVHVADAEVAGHLSTPGVLTTELEPTVFRGQQSNTSIMYGDVAMVKLFRRLELGHNLDIEVHDALARTGGRADVATLFGYLEAGWVHDGEPVRADLAMAVEKLAAAEEGWDLALRARRAGEPFAADAEQLGYSLATIHAALQQAFPTGRQPGSAVAAVMRQRLASAAAIAPALDPYVPGLEARFAALEDVELDLQRVHGDFHLGQTLRTPQGWKIIDFEGEPVKTLAERATPDSAWRDLAGMLRSFAYASASVPGPDAEAWTRACQDAFLAGYAGGELAADDAAVLRAYEADKAIYEVVYETRNRPDWVGIPLAAIAAIAENPQTTNQNEE